MRIRFTFFTVAALLATTTLPSLAFSPVDVLNFLTPSDTYTLQKDVAYGPRPRQQLDTYTPTSEPPAQGWPVVVFFYGGSWNRGERAQYRFLGEALASQGVLTVVADYRLYPEVRYPDFLDDSAAALAFSMQHAADWGGNPAKVFVMGHSAGAYNAAMLALDARWLAKHSQSPSQLAGWIGLAGPYDFFPITHADAKPVFYHPEYPQDSLPIDHISPTAPRALLMAATTDDLVNPRQNTLGMARRLEEARIPVTLKMHERVSHTTLIAAMSRPLRWMAPVLSDVVKFITL
ncbi:alpha/beta hydrolase [Rhodoferax sp.]|uniref:alpha/beta hydrolase n=1 Tax=Rhodoferax sp. TaxID=50421 RepID=UPI0025CF93B9|nr:alpha/beta hydrolase [Rhodoferax sp.]